ncbi:MAG: hypothetical protein MUE33_10270 [Cytophagaceae bacterium]|jgi:hypothetical protein|nr:hypothetical protein [Cytophagaceae bacterium]
MKFKIPFNEENFRDQMSVLFDITWQKNLSKNQLFLWSGLTSLVMTILLLYAHSHAAYVLIVLTTYSLGSYWNFIQHYKKFKKGYFSSLEEDIVNQNNTVMEWELEENFLKYKNYPLEIICNWNVIKMYREVGSLLFLYTNQEANVAFVLDEREIGEEGFKNVIALIKSKIV